MAINSSFPSREEYLKLKRKRKIVRYSLIAFLLILLFGVLSFISYRPGLRISKVELNGGILVTQSDVEKESLSFMSGTYYFVVPRNNAFVFPKEPLKQHLLNSFKRIETINIEREDFTSIKIDITERKPVAIWCDSLPNQSSAKVSTSTISSNSSSSHCYFMDRDGTIFAEAPYFSGDAYFKYYGNISTTTPISQSYIASTTQFYEVSNFIAYAKSLDIHPQYLVAEQDGQFSLVLSGGGEIYFDLKEPLSKTAKNLEALLKTQAISSIRAYDLPIQYIDLRFGNKLFYKLKGE